MAGGGFTDAAGKRAHLYEYKITGYFIFSCIVGAMGGSLFGYDLGVSGEFLLIHTYVHLHIHIHIHIDTYIYRHVLICSKCAWFNIHELYVGEGGVTSMDDFLIKFFPRVYANKHAHLQETDYCKYDDQILTLFTSSLYFAALVSTFFASSVTKNKGRKASIIVGSISFFMGGVINAAAVNIAMLLIGRILLGVGIGFGNQVSYIHFIQCSQCTD